HSLCDNPAPAVAQVHGELSQVNSVLVLVVLEPFEFSYKCCTLVKRILRKAPTEVPFTMGSGCHVRRDLERYAMRTALMAALLAVLPACSVRAQQVIPPGQDKTAPPKPEEQAPPKPGQGQKPVSLSPVMPVDAPNPAAMAEGPGKKPGGAPVGDAYIIGPEDVLGVKVWENGSFNGNYNVLPDGTISIPLLGPIRAAGLTPLQLEDAINQAALKYLNV